MKYKLIFEKGEYALIIRGEISKEYAVVYKLDKERGDWACTCCYYSCEDGAIALYEALDCFIMKTENNYISKSRCKELVEQFADGLMQDDKESALEYFNGTCEMTEYEKEFFGIE